MDNRQDDPQDDHLLEEVNVDVLCDRTGVEVLHFHPDQIDSKHECPSLTKLKRDRG